MVCLGNICRSPTAEAAFVEACSGWREPPEVDSAGTAAYHVGNPPDERMVAAGASLDLSIDGSARQATPDDFHRFDVIVAMDRANLRDLERIRPADATAELRLLRNTETGDDRDVPDPYYGGPEGFTEVVEIVRAATLRLAAELASR